MSTRVLRNLLTAANVVEHLILDGIDVSHVDISASKPKIWIRGRDDELRRKFGGALHQILPAGNGEREAVMAAPFNDCQLQWGYVL